MRILGNCPGTGLNSMYQGVGEWSFFMFIPEELECKILIIRHRPD